MQTWQMTDDEYFLQLKIKIIGITIICILFIVYYFYKKKEGE